MNALMKNFWEFREENKSIPIFGIVANQNNKTQPRGFVKGWTLKKQHSKRMMEREGLDHQQWSIQKFTYIKN